MQKGVLGPPFQHMKRAQESDGDGDGEGERDTTHHIISQMGRFVQTSLRRIVLDSTRINGKGPTDILHTAHGLDSCRASQSNEALTQSSCHDFASMGEVTIINCRE